MLLQITVAQTARDMGFPSFRLQSRLRSRDEGLVTVTLHIKEEIIAWNVVVLWFVESRTMA